MRNLKYNLKRILRIPKNVYLCLRFPFLYPRNRWTGRHYNNWYLHNKHCDLYKKYHIFVSEQNAYQSRMNTVNDKTWYLKELTTSGWCEYWTNWWAKPLVSVIDFLNDYVLQIFHCLPIYTELDDMPTGWRKAFGIQMCKDIKKALLKKGRKALYNYRITQIKEKFGALRWYDTGGTTEVSKIIHKYAYISERTCIDCGELATVYTPYEYWKSPYCDNCAPKRSKYLIDFGIYSSDNNTSADSWYGWAGDINHRDDYKERQQKFDEYLNLRQ